MNSAFPCKAGLDSSILNRTRRSQTGLEATIAPHDTGLVLSAPPCLGFSASGATPSGTVSTLRCRFLEHLQ